MSKTIEEMARELADNDFACPTDMLHRTKKTSGLNCGHYNIPTPERQWAGCEDCWMANATPSEIRAAYEKMKGERK